MGGYNVKIWLQIKIIHTLFEVWCRHPELRLGQLIYCVIKDKDLFVLHDEQLLELLEKFGL